MRFTLILTVIILCISSSLAISQSGNGTANEWEDVILLKTGVSFRGIIFEQIPNKYYKIRLYDGSILEFKAENVDVVTRQPIVKHNNLQSEESQNKHVQPTKIYSTYNTQTKPLWLTVGPYLNLGLSSGGSDYDPRYQAFYGIGLGASVGTKIGDNAYVMGMLSADFNRVASDLPKDNSTSSTEVIYASKQNVYRIGAGISHKIQDFFGILQIGEVFAENWDQEYLDYSQNKVPEKYSSDNNPFISAGLIFPISDGLVVSTSCDVTKIFNSLTISIKLGLVYTPIF